MDEELKGLVEQGRKEFASRNYYRAFEVFSRALGYSEQMADVLNLMGLMFHDMGNLPAARQAFRQALEINPAFADAALNLSLTLNDLGVSQEEKAKDLKDLGAAMPKREQREDYVTSLLANRYADIGELYASIERYEEALLEFRRALALRPQYHDIRVQYAAALRHAGRLSEAIEQCRTILDARPELHAARCLLGLCLHLNGDDDSARTAWQEVIRRDPGNRLATVYLASVNKDASNRKA